MGEDGFPGGGGTAASDPQRRRPVPASGKRKKAWSRPLLGHGTVFLFFFFFPKHNVSAAKSGFVCLLETAVVKSSKQEQVCQK